MTIESPARENTSSGQGENRRNRACKRHPDRVGGCGLLIFFEPIRALSSGHLLANLSRDRYPVHERLPGLQRVEGTLRGSLHLLIFAPSAAISKQTDRESNQDRTTKPAPAARRKHRAPRVFLSPWRRTPKLLRPR